MSPASTTGSPDNTQASRANCLLDLGVFAPLGLALTWRDLIPQLAKAGRDQIAMSRSLGRAAIKGVARGGQTAGSASAPATPQSAAKQSAAKQSASAFDQSGYGERSARDIIATLQACSDAEAAWIRRQEESGKQRVTVLRALDQRS